MTRLRSLLFILVLVQSVAQAQTGLVNHWETVVYDSSVWHYFPGTSDPGSDWTSLNFDDNSWTQGRGSIGYGDGDDRTTISPVMSVFLRKKFTITDKTIIAALQLNVDYDDGFIAYLNGVEIARANMSAGVPIFDQATPIDHEALLYQGQVPDKWEVNTELLITGENILTVEVHNVSFTSSDLTAAPFLSVGMANSATTYGPVPSWFVPPLMIGFTSSNLPIIKIQTNGQLIESGVKIVADMGVIDNGTGNRNLVSDAPNNYDGKISIEIHGESSQMFPKKSYRLETEDNAGNNLNVSLLGMPSENDWILYAPYTDKSMMRNMLAYQLGRDLGRFYAPRAKFVEIVLNGDYQGVYMLVEKIKRDKQRVDISKLTAPDIVGDDLTGGYLLRVDKIDAGNYPAWTPIPSPHLSGEGDVTFQYYDPKGEDMVPVQRTYIQNFILQLESTLSATNFTDPVNGYRKYINVSSFIDFLLVSEVSKSVDAYVYSTYMSKDKDSKGGKLIMGPLWDFDLGFGNVNYLQNSQYAPGWTYNDNYRMFWFRRLMSDGNFADSVKCRWNELRKSYFSNGYITNTLDSVAGVLGESQLRNFERWPILGTYVWPNQYIGATFQDEVNFLKTWVTTRLNWMDDNLPGNCELTTGLEPKHLYNQGAIVPNPAQNSVRIEFEKKINNPTQLIVYNCTGQLIFTGDFSADENIAWDGLDRKGNYLSPGLYLLEVRSSGRVVFRGKLIRL